MLLVGGLNLQQALLFTTDGGMCLHRNEMCVYWQIVFIVEERVT